MRVMVIDVSIVAAWTLDDEKTEAGRQLLVEAKSCLRLTSSLFWHEYRNILVINQRRGRLVRESLPLMLHSVRQLQIQPCENEDDEQVLALALQHGLSAYDAAYLALALDYQAILATNDKQLARAAYAHKLPLRTLLAPRRP